MRCRRSAWRDCAHGGRAAGAARRARARPGGTARDCAYGSPRQKVGTLVQALGRTKNRARDCQTDPLGRSRHGRRDDLAGPGWICGAARRPLLWRRRRCGGWHWLERRAPRNGHRHRARHHDQRAHASQLWHGTSRGLPQSASPYAPGRKVWSTGSVPGRYFGRVLRHRCRGARPGRGDCSESHGDERP